VVFPTQLDKKNMTFDAGSDMKRIGGPVHLEQKVTVQVYVDHSAVEVFLSSGEALATRYVMSLLPHHHFLVSQIQSQGAVEGLTLLCNRNTLYTGVSVHDFMQGLSRGCYFPKRLWHILHLSWRRHTR